MGWEWRVFYNLRRAGLLGDSGGFLAQGMPELLNVGAFQPDNDDRADQYFLLDFSATEQPPTPAKADDDNDDSEDPVTASSPSDVGLKLRGGEKAGLELKLRLKKKQGPKSEKWKKYALNPDVPLPEGALQGIQQGPDAQTQLLQQYYKSSLLGYLPTSDFSVRGIAKVSKQRGQQTVNGVLLEHTLVRIESDTMPGVVIVADSFALGAKKDAMKEFLKTKPVGAQADALQGLVMGYPELLFKLFVTKELKV